MKKILLLITLVSTLNVFAQQKVIKMNARVGGTMITFSLYQKQTDNSYLLIDSKEEDSGQWTFDSLNAGIYRVHMSMDYAKYIPTWHPRKAVWDEAADIDLTTADTALCDEGMLPNPSFTGPASISGELIEGLLKNAGDPLKNVRVVIKDGTGSLVKMTSTNDSGKFVAGNLPVGSYKIIVDVINVSTANPKTVVLDSTNLNASVDLTVSTNGTVNTGLKNYLDHGVPSINVYPNPTTDMVYVNSDRDVKVAIYSIQGVLVREAMVNNNQSLSIESLPKGLYIATLVAPGTGEVISKKIVKE